MKNLKICDNCGKCFEDVKVKNRKYPSRFCCYNCYDIWNRFNKEPNCTCSVCGKPMYMKPFRLNRLKHEGKIVCSRECSNLIRSEWMKGELNHQFGLIGELNSSFKKDDSLLKTNYVMSQSKIKNKRMLKHRMLVEENWTIFGEKYFNKNEDGTRELKRDYIVHHINEDRSDNRLENLQILTRSQHSKLHAKNNYKNREIDKLGRFKKGVIK